MTMKKIPNSLLSTVLMFAAAAFGQGTQNAGASAPQTQQSQPTPTIVSTVDREINTIEKLILEAAEAMPENKFNFGNLHSAFTSANPAAVAQPLPAAAIQALANLPTIQALFGPTDFCACVDCRAIHGPAAYLVEILQFLKESFALGHKAAATLTPENMLQTGQGSKSPRLYLATFGVAHAYDHYGQMVEYLRMNGIVPPASRGKSD